MKLKPRIKKKHLASAISFLLMLSFLQTVYIPKASAQTTTLSVDPPLIVDPALTPGSTFYINITVTDVEDLWGYQFVLDYNTTVLTATSYESYAPFGQKLAATINDTLGRVALSYTMPFGTGEGEGKYGTVPLAKITFSVDALGVSKLHLSDTKMMKPTDPAGIPHDVNDGFFSNTTVLVVPIIVDETLTPGSEFYINITVAGVSKLWIFEFKLSFDPTVLTATLTYDSNWDFVNDSAITPYPPFDALVWGTPEVDNVNGYVYAAHSSFMGDPDGLTTTDPVPIAKVTFKVKAFGESVLDMEETKLAGVGVPIIPHEAVDGYFSNQPARHDVAITSVTATPTNVTVGEPVFISLTVTNQGTFNETFDVSIYYDMVLIQTRIDVNLTVGSTTTLNLTWNTFSVAEGTYAISAEVSVVPGEVDTEDNVYVDGMVTVQKHALPGRWIVEAPLPEPREGAAGAVVDGKVYVLKGYNPMVGDTGDVRIYDPVTNTWSSGTLSTNVDSEFYQAGVVDGKIYVIGGRNSFTGNEEYNPRTDTWTSKAKMPTGRAGHALGVVDGIVYVIGGRTGSVPLSGNVLNVVEAYNPTMNTWITGLAPMPTSRSDMAVAVVDGKIYVMGGWNGMNIINTVEVYDPVANTWSSRAAMPTPRADLGATESLGGIHALGGININQVQVSTHEVYDPAANTWLVAEPMPTSRAELVVVNVGPTIFAIGGGIFGLSKDANETFVVPVEHDLAVSLQAPTSLPLGESTLLNATVVNFGTENETNVQLHLLIDGATVNDTQVPLLESSKFAQVTYLWTPTSEATYNVTAYASLVPGENITLNNQVTRLVTVALPLIRPVEGQWANYTITSTEKLTNTSLIMLLNSTYSRYISPFQMNVTLRMTDPGGGAMTMWLILNVMTRQVEAGIWAGMWYPLWIETNVTLGSEVNILDGVGTVTGSRLVEVGEFLIDSWELQVQSFDTTYTFLFDKATGLVTGWEGESPFFTQTLELVATNILKHLRVRIDPESGPVGTGVTVTGGDATPGGSVEIYWDDTLLGITVADIHGNFSFTLTVPPSAREPHHVIVIDVTTRIVGIATFTVVSSISITPTTGPTGTMVQATGFGFGANEHVVLSFDDMRIAEVLADEYGSFSATFSIPLSEASLHSIKAWYDLNFVETTFAIVDVTPLEIQIDVGTIYFKGETAEFYVQTSFKGVPVDVTPINVRLYKPDGTAETLTAQRISTGLYKIEYPLKGKRSMLGTYTLVVEANYSSTTVNATGTSLKTFIVKSPWREWEREAPKVALSVATIAAVFALVIVWRREDRKLKL